MAAEKGWVWVSLLVLQLKLVEMEDSELLRE